MLTCVLCSNHGGAYKPTEKSGQWVHSLCAFWIPEIFTTRIRGVPTFTLTSLDKKRFKLNCNLCKSKGACIQCSYGRCAVAAHPYCVLTQPQGFTRRTIKDDRGELLWEVFCKPHASAVSEPLKPKAKVKLQDDFEEEEEEIIYETVVKTRKIESKAKDDSRYNSLSMSHALAFNTGSSQTVRPGLIGYRQSSILHDDDEDDEDDDEDDDKKKNKKSRAGKGKAPSSSTRSSSAPVLLTSSSTQSYPVHTMSEWPGQTEGEAMDLTHFWNVVSMSFPEDHTSEVNFRLLFEYFSQYDAIMSSL